MRREATLSARMRSVREPFASAPARAEEDTPIPVSLDRNQNFVAKCAHELRTPLSSIISACDVAGMALNDTGATRSCLDIIARQSQFMRRLIDEMFDTACVSGGHTTLRNTTIDLREVLATAAETCRPLSFIRRQSLELQADAQPVRVHADAMRLHQVFVNLIQNALKYTPEEGRVEVILEAAPHWGVVRVRDSGIGISCAMLSRIFEMFAQVTPAHDSSGRGVGLAVVRELVLLHGGTVEATSDGVGKGSEFVVRLPVDESLPFQKPEA